MEKTYIIKTLFNNYTKKFLPKIFLSVFFSLCVAASTSSIAWLLDPAIEKIFIEKDKSLLLIIPLAIIAAFTVKGFSLYFARVILIRIAQEVTKLLQFDLMKSLINSDLEVINKKHSGKIIGHLTMDVGFMTNLISTVILNIFKDTLTLIGLIGVMFYQNWKLAFFAIIMIPLASFAARSLGKRMGKITTQAQEEAGKLNSYILEIFKNHKIIKIFQKEDYEFSRANNVLDGLKEKMTKISVVLNRASPIMETLTGIMIAGLIYYAGQLIFTEELEVNNFFSFLAAMMLAYQPVRSLATLNMSINQGISAGQRILPLIEAKSKIFDKAGSEDYNINNADISFNDVNFEYEINENKVLENVNLKIEGGKMTALVGHSGAGKSTILNLIPRFYDISSGDIKIDDRSIYKIKLKSLRSCISLVSQDVTLFDDTIKNNIVYGNSAATENEISDAIKFSYCIDFIKNLPNKENTIIGENGVRLSGGEKQRISIARAMLKKSKIILLDEATSSLDADTEHKIQEAIKLLTKNRTTVVIAHRLSTIMMSDNIYVLEKGRIISSGKHSELVKNSEIYKSFYEKQLRKD
tara:strand:- start:11508 stop:13247 length:1740 start_codon:yes stop_codon:yes gene_type:complete